MSVSLQIKKYFFKDLRYQCKDVCVRGRGQSRASSIRSARTQTWVLNSASLRLYLLSQLPSQYKMFLLIYSDLIVLILYSEPECIQNPYLLSII